MEAAIWLPRGPRGEKLKEDPFSLAGVRVTPGDMRFPPFRVDLFGSMFSFCASPLKMPPCLWQSTGI